jgi:hypothetical protein
MKNLLITSFLLLGTLTLLSLRGKHNSANPDGMIDEQKELAAIMKVLDSETNNFFDGDYDGYAKNWTHSDLAMSAWNNRDGSATVNNGWEKISAEGKKWTEYYRQQEKVTHPDFKRKNLKYRFLTEKIAYLNWDQYVLNKERTHYEVCNDTRLMEKIQGDWRISNMISLWRTEPNVHVDSLKLD